MHPEKPTIQNSKSVALKPLIIAVMMVISLYTGIHLNRQTKDKFSQLFDIIQRDYVDSVKSESLEENTIDYLLSQLDPHSSYIPPQLTELNERQIRGNYQGLGLEYIKFQDTLFVFNVYPESPADKAGVQAGDRLLQAGTVKLTDSLGQIDIQNAMQSTVEERVKLKVFRRKTGQIIDFDIPKAQIVLNSSEVYYMVNKSLGYIKLERFSGNTHQDFLNALAELKAKGLKELILDLRNNGGGLVSEAAAIANEFLQKEDIISFTFGFHRKKNYYRADGNGQFKDGKLILLINHNTASASEILAGALQDNDRAVVIGNRSYGKGLVQEPFRLSDGSMLRLTIARYYTPSGRSIQKSYNKNIETYRNEIYKRDLLKDTLNPVLDSSIKKEFFSKNGRLLTPGGGIRPDVFLRDTISDSTEIEMLMPGLFYSRIFDIYVLDYLLQANQKEVSRYKDVFAFEDRFTVDRRDVLHFIEVAKKIKYLKNLKYSEKTVSIIQKHLKAALAYRIFGEQGRSLILNREDGIFSNSFDVLKNYNRILNIGSSKKCSFDY